MKLHDKLLEEAIAYLDAMKEYEIGSKEHQTCMSMLKELNDIRIAEQKAEIEREKLDLDKEKLEVEKQKSKLSKKDINDIRIAEQKAELEREKLDLDKEKLEVEKQKSKLSKKDIIVCIGGPIACIALTGVFEKYGGVVFSAAMKGLWTKPGILKR